MNHTKGALKAAEVIMNGKKLMSTEYGKKSLEEIADLIEIETAAPEIMQEEMRANASLIAAAPDLYRALVQLAFDVERGAGVKLIEDALQDARDAISKAEGRDEE